MHGWNCAEDTNGLGHLVVAGQKFFHGMLYRDGKRQIGKQLFTG